MHLQRIVLPHGRVTWTAYDGDQPVREIREFAIYLEARQYAPKTISTYVRHAVRLGNYLSGQGKRFDDITPFDFDRFIPALLLGDVTSTLSRSLNMIPLPSDRIDTPREFHNQVLFAIKAFYGFLNVRATSSLLYANEQDLRIGSEAYTPFLAHLGTRKVSRRREPRSIQNSASAGAKRAADRRLKPEQVLQIISSATLMRDAFLVIILYATGIRIGEARGLFHEDFRPEENIIWVTPRNLENGARVKGQRPRPIPIPDFIMDFYSDFLASDEYRPAFDAGSEFVFCNIKGGCLGRGLSEGNVYDVMDGLVRRSGVKFTWHMFRHTHASEAISQGYALIDVADRLGHASPQTTNSIYKHLFNTELRKSHSKSTDGFLEGLNLLRRAGFGKERARWL